MSLQNLSEFHYVTVYDITYYCIYYITYYCIMIYFAQINIKSFCLQLLNSLDTLSINTKLWIQLMEKT